MPLRPHAEAKTFSETASGELVRIVIGEHSEQHTGIVARNDADEYRIVLLGTRVIEVFHPNPGMRVLSFGRDYSFYYNPIETMNFQMPERIPTLLISPHGPFLWAQSKMTDEASVLSLKWWKLSRAFPVTLQNAWFIPRWSICLNTGQDLFRWPMGFIADK